MYVHPVLYPRTAWWWPHILAETCSSHTVKIGKWIVLCRKCSYALWHGGDILNAVIFTIVMQYATDFAERARQHAFIYHLGDGTDDWHGSSSLSTGNTYGTYEVRNFYYGSYFIQGKVTRKYSSLTPVTDDVLQPVIRLLYCAVLQSYWMTVRFLFIHSLVFSLIGRAGRNQSPVMWPVWLWHTASWASTWG